MAHSSEMNDEDPDDWSSTWFSIFEEENTFDSNRMSILNLETYKVEDNDPEDEEKICAICGDKSNGYHFHVMTCEGCKGFFRRTINKGLKYHCIFNGSCLITKATRRSCPACRLQKCLEVGMRKDMILSDEALLAWRDLRRRKKQERLQRVLNVAAVGSLTKEQKQLISILLEAKKHFDSKFENFVGYRLQPQVVTARWGSTPITGTNNSPFPGTQEWMESDVTPENFKEIPHLADLTTYMIQQVVKFAKEIPAFRTLKIDDQISLLKGATMEISEIQCNSVFNLENNQWQCNKAQFGIEDCAFSGLQKVFLEPLQKFHITLRKLNLDIVEIALIQGLSLFSPDRPGIIDHSDIDKIQENVALTLKCYIDYHHPLPDSRFLYGKLLSLMTELRTLNNESAKQIIHIQTLTSDAITPLMKEIFS